MYVLSYQIPYIDKMDVFWKKEKCVKHWVINVVFTIKKKYNGI